MKKIISLVLVLAFCVAFVCPVFATEGFTSSPGLEPGGCSHGSGTSIVGGFDASCTADGYTGDHVCDDCGAVVEPGQTIVKKHNYDASGVCTDCHSVDPAVSAGGLSPETGDNSMVSVWAVVMVVAVAGLVGLTAVYRKKCTHQ